MNRRESHFQKKKWHFYGGEEKEDAGICQELHCSSDKSQQGDDVTHIVSTQ